MHKTRIHTIVGINIHCPENALVKLHKLLWLYFNNFNAPMQEHFGLSMHKSMSNRPRLFWVPNLINIYSTVYWTRIHTL